MKFIFALLLAFISFSLRAQEVSSLLTQKAKINVQNYLKADPLLGKSYIPGEWTPFNKISAMDVKLLKKTDDAQLNVKIDSLIALQKEFPGYPKQLIYYTTMHAFKVTSGVKKEAKIYSFSFDKLMNIVDVDKRPIEEQIETQKVLMANADIVIRLIQETTQMRQDMMRKKFKAGQ